MVRLGFKQTEVGEIPEDWEVGALPDFSWFQEGPGLRNWQFTKNGMKVINVSNLENGYLDLSKTDRHISLDEFSRIYSHFAVDVGDIVIASSGNSYCKTAVVRECDLPLLMNTSVIRFKPINGFDYNFLLIYIKSCFFKYQIDSMITGGAQPNFGPFHLRKIYIPVPQVREQQAISEALSDVDNLIDGLEKLIAKKRDIKTATMQQLLTGKTRLPGFGGDWEVKRLGDGVELHSGHHVLAQHCNTQSEGVPYLTGPADFPEGQICHTKFTTRPSTICSPGDILVTVKGSGSGTIVLADAGYCISRQLMAIRVNNWDVRFVYYSLLQNAKQVRAASTGLIPGLSRSDILEQPLPIPPTNDEQIVIAEVLTDMDADLAALEQRRDKIKSIKQGMMQELLTGRSRLI